MQRILTHSLSRGSLLLWGVQLLFVALAVRLVVIQVARHDQWTARAEAMESGVVELPAQRGMILDRQGRQLAVTVKTWSATANPRMVPEEERAAMGREVAEVLDMTPYEVRRKLAQTELERITPEGERVMAPRYYVAIRHGLSGEEAIALLRKRLPGIELRPGTQREYPQGPLLGHVLGFVGMDGIGLEGLEAQCDSLLGGRAGEREVARDGLGRALADDEPPRRRPVDGRSLVLTIDTRVQRIVEDELAKLAEEHKPQSACAVVMDPHAGDVLAMATWPAFDPSEFENCMPSDWRNMAVVECLEPGSTFKPFTVAAALEQGVVTPETKFDCHKGVWRIGGRTLHDAHAFEILSVRDIIAFSSNIGMAQVAERLGPERLYRALRAFGFGRPTGIELAGESAGILRPTSQWTRLSLSSLPMGQEVACSPLQLVAGFCVFANGGWYVRPRIVLGTADADGRKLLRRMPPSPRRRVLSEETADLMCSDLLAAVVERGTARRCALDGYTMAGKTGTAQIARPNGGGYEQGAYTAAFVGIVPVQSPRFVIGVIAQRPGGESYYGGVVAAPAASRMADRILSLYRVERVASRPAPRRAADRPVALEYGQEMTRRRSAQEGET